MTTSTKLKKVIAGFYTNDKYEILFLRSYWRVSVRNGEQVAKFLLLSDAKDYVAKAGK